MAIELKLPISTGGIPWKTEKNEPGVDTKSLVDHRFALVQDMIDQATTDFELSMTAMRQTLQPIVVNTIPTSGIVVTDLAESIPDFTGTFTSVFSATLDAFNVAYTEPSGKPDGENFVWEDGVFYLQPELINKLAVWLTSGESAIPQALFDEIYLTATTQFAEDVLQRKLEYISEAAARGWSCPADVEAARLLQLEREYSKGAAEISAKIAERNMELIQANFHKAVEVAAQYVNTQMDYNIKKNTAKIQWYATAVDAWAKQVEAEISRIQAEVAAFQGKIEAYKAEAMVYETEANVFETTVKAYTAQVEAIKVKIMASIETIKTEVEAFKADASVKIENEKLRVEAQIANNELGQRIAEAESNFHSHLMVSGMSTLHVQASVSASHGTGEQVGFSYSYGENYSEQQSKSESVTVSQEIE